MPEKFLLRKFRPRSIGGAPKEWRRRRAEKRSSKRVFWRVRFFSSHLRFSDVFSANLTKEIWGWGGGQNLILTWFRGCARFERPCGTPFASLGDVLGILKKTSLGRCRLPSEGALAKPRHTLATEKLTVRSEQVTYRFLNFSRSDPCSVDFGRETPKFRFEFCRGFFGGFFLLFFPRKNARKNPPKNPPQNSPGTLFGKIPLGFLQKPFLDNFSELLPQKGTDADTNL